MDSLKTLPVLKVFKYRCAECFLDLDVRHGKANGEIVVAVVHDQWAPCSHSGETLYLKQSVEILSGHLPAVPLAEAVSV